MYLDRFDRHTYALCDGQKVLNKYFYLDFLAMFFFCKKERNIYKVISSLR